MINNYLARYDLKSEENFEKIEKVIENKEYYVYKEIFQLIDSCRIVTTGPKGNRCKRKSSFVRRYYAQVFYNKTWSKKSRKKSWTWLYYWESICFIKDPLFLK